MGRLAILWHLHQPEYRDPTTGRPVMPWTRLHALRGYRDLAVETLRHDAPVTINVVPVLLDQLEDYAAGITDEHLDLTRVPAEALDPVQVDRIRSTFVAGHEAMMRAHPGWWALVGKVRSGAALSTDELRDLQVWSTLQWFGATAVEDFEAVRALRSKGRGFSEEDKAAMLDVMGTIVAELPGLFGRIARTGRASLSTTPYHHPILPLLVDVRHAARNLGSVPDDVDFAWPEDAQRHLDEAASRTTEAFGVRLRGLWPSEGSVSPEVLPLAARAGFRWLATDEEVLARSEHTPADRPGPWDLGHGLVGFFRDHDLSDRVGFTYASMPADEAVADLVGTAAERAGDGILTVILDGENPWETFADAGAAFRRGLYEALEHGPIRGIALDEAAETEPVGTVTHLHTGSWIGADFRIWYGDPEDHAAWRLLAQTRRAAEASPHRDEALRRLLPAEGSDWTWWYGSEFSTPFAGTFDRLFREHLLAAWRAMGQAPPAALHEPIKVAPPPQATPPSALVQPRLEARLHWVHWRGAGTLRLAQGAMARGQRHTDGLAYGWDAAGDLWVAVHRPSGHAEDEVVDWTVTVDHHRVSLPRARPGDEARDGGVDAVLGREALVLRVRSDPDAPPADDRVSHLVIEVVDAEGRRARYPDRGVLTLPHPPLAPALTWWSV